MADKLWENYRKRNSDNAYIVLVYNFLHIFRMGEGALRRVLLGSSIKVANLEKATRLSDSTGSG